MFRRMVLLIVLSIAFCAPAMAQKRELVRDIVFQSTAGTTGTLLTEAMVQAFGSSVAPTTTTGAVWSRTSRNADYLDGFHAEHFQPALPTSGTVTQFLAGDLTWRTPAGVDLPTTVTGAALAHEARHAWSADTVDGLHAAQLVGATGPQGPQGPQGETGAQGPAGTSGRVAGPFGTSGYFLRGNGLSTTATFVAITGSDVTTTVTSAQYAHTALYSLSAAPGTALDFFLTETEANIAGHDELMRQPTGGAEQSDVVSVTAAEGEKLIDQYVTAPGVPGLMLWRGGVWQAGVWGSVSSAAGNTNIRVKLYRRTSAGSETLLGTIATPEINNTTAAYTATDIAISDSTGSASDRLVVRYYAYTTNVSAITVSLYYEGTTHYTHIHTPMANVIVPTLPEVVAAGNNTTSTGVVNNALNADKLDGLHSSAFVRGLAFARWTTVTATIAIDSTSKIRTETEGTGNGWRAGSAIATTGTAVSYTFAGARYYGQVAKQWLSTATGYVQDVEIRGTALPYTTGTLTSFAIGQPEMAGQVDFFVPGKYGDGANTALLDSDANTYFAWSMPEAYVVGFAVRHKTNDTGANQPKVNVRVNGNRIGRGNSGAGVIASTSWATNASADIISSRNKLLRGYPIEIECSAAGSNANASDLTVSLFVVFR